MTLLAFAWLSFDYRSFWIDDAFITFRYAKNLAEGHGPLFNLIGGVGTGMPVEGYTNFLWMLATSLFFAIAERDTALAGIKMFGFGLGVLTLVRIYTFPAPDSPRRRVGALLLATHPIYVANCGDGLETPLFMALGVECTRRMVGRLDVRSGGLTGLLTAGLIWTRPEAIPLIAVIPGVVGVFELRANNAYSEFRAWLRAFLLAVLLPVVAHSCWRYLYYGAWLPNTYYAKATGDAFLRLSDGLLDVAGFTWGADGLGSLATGFGLILAVIGTVILGLRGGAIRWLLTLWLFVVFRVSFDIWSGGEYMGAYRFLCPLLPFLCVLADEGARVLWAWGRTPMRIGLVSLCIAVVFANVIGHERLLRSREGYRLGLENGHIALGKWLREVYPRDTLLAVGDAGAVPFYSGLPSIDLWGLNTVEIAKLPGEYGRRDGMPDWVFSRKPKLVILWNRHPADPVTRGMKFKAGSKNGFDIFHHPQLREHYRFVREFVNRERTASHAGYYLDVFERRSDRHQGLRPTESPIP